MLYGKPYKTETGNDDERVIVEEMKCDPHSEHWDFCRKYVARQVRKREMDMQPSDQDEVVQEIMEKAMKNLSTFRFESALSSWLNTIIRHCITDRYRRVATEQKYLERLPGQDDEKDGGSLPQPGPTTEENVEEQEQIKAYVKALFEYAEKHRPERDKIILYLFVKDEFNQAEIAKRANCSATTVKNVIDAAHSYALEKLKREEWGNEQQ